MACSNGGAFQIKASYSCRVVSCMTFVELARSAQNLTFRRHTMSAKLSEQTRAGKGQARSCWEVLDGRNELAGV